MYIQGLLRHFVNQNADFIDKSDLAGENLTFYSNVCQENKLKLFL